MNRRLLQKTPESIEKLFGVNLPEVSNEEVENSIELIPAHYAWTEQLNQSLTLQGGLPPASYGTGVNYAIANTNANFSGVNMNVIRRLTSIVKMGIMNVNSNITVYYVASANANMTGNSNVLDGNGVAYSAFATNANATNQTFSIELRSDQLPAGTQYVATAVNIQGAFSNASVDQIGGEGAYKPVSALDPSNQSNGGLVLFRSAMPVA